MGEEPNIVFIRVWVRSLALLGGFRIQHRLNLWLRDVARNWRCCGHGIGQQLQLRFDYFWELLRVAVGALKRTKSSLYKGKSLKKCQGEIISDIKNLPRTCLNRSLLDFPSVFAYFSFLLSFHA